MHLLSDLQFGSVRRRRRRGHNKEIPGMPQQPVSGPTLNLQYCTVQQEDDTTG